MNAEKVWGRQLLLSMAAYVVTLMASQALLNSMDATPLRYIIAIIPTIPILFGLAAFMRYLRHIDELQIRIQLEGFGFSLAATGIITFTLGFLESAGIPQIGMIWVFPLSIFMWGIGVFIAGRRYR